MGLDRRIIKSEEAIKEAFLYTLTQNNDLKKVTISLVSKNANVNRATFYRHFKSIEQLRKIVFSEYIDHISMANIPAVPFATDMDSRRDFAMAIEEIVRYVGEHKKAYEYLIASTEGRALIHDYIHDCIEIRIQIDNLPMDDKRYLSEMTYRIYGIIGVLQDWASGMLDITNQELSQKLAATPAMRFK